jgi:hypothetical protein
LKYLNKSHNRFKFLIFLVVGLIIIIIIALFSFIFVWWLDTAKTILLNHYNAYIFNPDSNGYGVRYAKVLSQDIERVKNLETSLMGIGWPLKSIFMFVFLSPLPIVFYVFNFFKNQNKI